MTRERDSYAADVCPLGALHFLFVCAFCGDMEAVRPTVLGPTREEAAICIDVVECVRRENRQRARELEDA